MKFMIMIKADKNTEAGILPSAEILAQMGKYNEELVKAGVLLAGEGLHPSSKGARVSFKGGKMSVVDGPFAEAKELIAGFWLWEVGSKEEALDWLKRSPFQEVEIEVRPVFSAQEFEPGGDPEGDLRATEEQLHTKFGDKS